jgi:2-oxoisovalerate dehydrogenase E1 component
MEELYFPQKDWLIDAIHERILPLPGRTVITNQSTLELARRNRLGV